MMLGVSGGALPPQLELISLDFYVANITPASLWMAPKKWLAPGYGDWSKTSEKRLKTTKNVQKTSKKPRNFVNAQEAKNFDFFSSEGPPGANSAYLVRGAAAPRPQPRPRPNERTNERANERTNEGTKERGFV